MSWCKLSLQVPDQVTFIFKERPEADYYESFILKEYGLATASEGNVLSIFSGIPQWQIYYLSGRRLQWSTKTREVFSYRESLSVFIHIHSLLRKIIKTHSFCFSKMYHSLIPWFFAVHFQFLSKRWENVTLSSRQWFYEHEIILLISNSWI